MVTAVIFDIDGTLFDWETAVRDAIEAVLPDVSPEARDGLPERFAQALEDYAFVRRGDAIVDRRHWLLRGDPEPPWFAALPDENPTHVTQLAHQFRSHLRPVPFSDAHPALTALRAAYRLGALTNSPRGEESLSQLGLRDFFETAVVLGDDERKPRAVAFAKACKAMQIDPREGAHVGDSIINDVEGALNAGLRSIWIDRYHEPHLLPSGTVRVESLVQLPEVLAGQSD